MYVCSLATRLAAAAAAVAAVVAMPAIAAADALHSSSRAAPGSPRFFRLVCFASADISPDVKNCDTIAATHAYVQPLPSHGKAQVSSDLLFVTSQHIPPNCAVPPSDSSNCFRQHRIRLGCKSCNSLLHFSIRKNLHRRLSQPNPLRQFFSEMVTADFISLKTIRSRRCARGRSRRSFRPKSIHRRNTDVCRGVLRPPFL
jgi:hypothetical protein